MYDEEIVETLKPDGLEKQPEQVANSFINKALHYWFFDDVADVNAAFGSFKEINVLPKEKTREQKEAELIPKMQEAVNYGLRVLESAFEHLDIKAGNSDSEDEEVPDKVEAILEPKVRS